MSMQKKKSENGMKDKLSTILNVGTAIGLVIAALAWVEFRVDKAIVERVQPYESLLAGLSLHQTGSHELAIFEFRKVVKSIKLAELNEERLAAIIDPYLAAIAFSEQAVKYESDFQKILPLVETKTGLRGERHNSIGYIYLFTNRPKKAVEAFNNSIAYFAMEQESPDVADSHWGLSLSYMAIGDLENAIKHYESAWDINYAEFGIEDTYNYRITENDYGVQLIEMYPKFEPTSISFYQALEDTYEIKAKLKRQDMKK